MEVGQSGHPTRLNRTLDDVRKEKLLASLEAGSPVVKACEAVGVPRSTYYDWLQRDRNFAVAVSHSIGASIQSVEDALFVTAMSGNIAAIKFFLKNRAPDRWKEKPEVESSASDDLNRAIASEQTVILAGRTNGEIEP